jgi:hypothetical protein
LERLQDRIAGDVEPVAAHPLYLADPNRDASEFGRIGVDLDPLDRSRADVRELALKPHSLGLNHHSIFEVP